MRLLGLEMQTYLLLRALRQRDAEKPVGGEQVEQGLSGAEGLVVSLGYGKTASQLLSKAVSDSPFDTPIM